MIVQEGEKEEEMLDLIKINDTAYEFKRMVPQETNLYIEPRLKDESTLLFYPKILVVEVAMECIDDIKFQAKKGLIITGNIDPPTEEVQLTILNSITKEEVVTVMSDASGAYKVGPLYDDQTYEITAFKEDYNFEETSFGNFKAQKLSSLTIVAKDLAGNPLPQVFLQLSAGKLRLSGTTDVRGIFKFVDLQQGKFYVSAILKEYEFTQAQATIQLQDGDHSFYTLEAKRVAYSAFGSVL